MKIKFLLILIGLLTTTNANIIYPSFELGVQFNPYIDMGNIKSKLYNYSRLNPQLENNKLKNLFDWMPGINLYGEFGIIWNLSLFLGFQYNSNSFETPYYDEIHTTLTSFESKISIYKKSIGINYSYQQSNSRINFIFKYLQLKHLYEIIDNSTDYDSITYNLNGLDFSIGYTFNINRHISINSSVDYEYTKYFKSLWVNQYIDIHLLKGISSTLNVSYDFIEKPISIGIGIKYNYTTKKKHEEK